MIQLFTRDVVLSVRSGGGFGLALVFFLIVVVLMPFALGCISKNSTGFALARGFAGLSAIIRSHFWDGL